MVMAVVEAAGVVWMAADLVEKAVIGTTALVVAKGTEMSLVLFLVLIPVE